jgi:hypothetical protein
MCLWYFGCDGRKRGCVDPPLPQSNQSFSTVNEHKHVSFGSKPPRKCKSFLVDLEGLDAREIGDALVIVESKGWRVRWCHFCVTAALEFGEERIESGG